MGMKCRCINTAKDWNGCCKELFFKADFLLFPLGTSDMVLGVQWICTLGGHTWDINFSFSRLTMKFEYEGKKMMLQVLRLS